MYDVATLPNDVLYYANQYLACAVGQAAPALGNFSFCSLLNPARQSAPFQAYLVEVERILVSSDIAGVIRIGVGTSMPNVTNDNNQFRDTRQLSQFGVSIPPIRFQAGVVGALPGTSIMDRFNIVAGVAAYVEALCTPFVLSPNDNFNAGFLYIIHETVTTPTLNVRLRYRLRPAEETEVVG